MILNPSCSETVFRLKGDLGKIKTEVNHMLDDIYTDYSTSSSDKAWFNDIKKQISEKREQIAKVEKLNDFENIYFPFTCNYETFFKPDGEDLLVATCNNHPWDTVEYIPEDSDDRHKIVPKIYVRCVCAYDDWAVLDGDFSNKNSRYFLQGFNKCQIKFLQESDKSVLYMRKDSGKFTVFADTAAEVFLITDEKLLEHINKTIVARDL
jgi:hypothetical protein